ncbi:MAG: restriction endonuclease subunit S, partial [Candidatus Portnoybacteria bacterium]|nr:restriction endonuclease subunit S [Candidatus Portnoybacteria bacterium]
EIVDDNPKFYPTNTKEPIEKYKLIEDDLLISLTGNVGRVGLLPKEFLPAGLNQRVACLRVDEHKISKRFLFRILNQSKFEQECIKSASGMAQKNMSTVWLAKYKIPLPPIEVQKEICEQIEVKQKAIEAAKAVIDNLERERRYFGQSLRKIKDVEWVELRELLEDVKYTNKIQKSEFKRSGKFPIVDQSQSFIAGYWDKKEDVFSIKKPVVIFGDHTRAIKYIDFDFVLGADGVKILQPNDKIISKFLYFILLSAEIKNLGYSRHFKELVRVKIPLLPLETQKQLVAEMEEQEKIIEANKKLVGIMEQKITEVLSEI